jgi:hypothetical protein
MSTMYDLEGALRARQWGLVTTACRGLLTLGVILVLLDGGVTLPVLTRREREWRLAIDTLDVLSPPLSAEAWRLYLSAILEDEAARAHSRRVLEFVGRCVVPNQGHLSLSESLQAWASATQELMAVCGDLGVPINQDWYLAPTTANGDWYTDLLRHLEEDV